MTRSHWLVVQSVTSYKYHPGTGPRVGSLLIVGLLALSRIGEHTSLYWQYGAFQAAAPAERDLQ